MRWDELNNESAYERCGMRGCGSGVECGVVEWVKRSSRWEDRVHEYVNESGVRGNALDRTEGSAWTGRGGNLSIVGTPLGDAPRGSEASELLID